MIEPRNGARFPPEPLEPIACGQLGRANDLQRNRAVEASVAGAIDLAHAARSETFKAFEGAEACASNKDMTCPCDFLHGIIGANGFDVFDALRPQPFVSHRHT
jgi:hypothetical protein